MVVCQMRSLLLSALVVAAACGPGGRHLERIRALEAKTSNCPAEQLQIERIEKLTSNLCYAATYRVSGCGQERQYKCTQRNSAELCSFRCDPITASTPSGTGPGGIVSHQCGGRPCPQPEPVDPIRVDPTWHHHAETCWIDGQGADDPSDVDMMLYVVGLNHGFEKPFDATKAVDREGVNRLAEVIAAWPYPDRAVIISSSFTQDCLPTSGKCLEEALERLTDKPFALREVIAFPGYPPTIGVISGSRWQPEGPARQRFPPSNPGSAIAEVMLRDTVTGVVVPVYALHTRDGDAGLDEIKTAAFLGKQASGGRVTPIIAGDFNMTVTTYGEENKSPTNAAYFQKNFHWLNYQVPCATVAGLQGGLFHTEDGNKMQALVGSTTAEDPAVAFRCAPHSLERVSLSYSVDVKGRLANPPPSMGTGPSWREGMALYDISHNVLAVGLRLERHEVSTCAAPLRAGARCDRPTGCASCPCAEGLTCRQSADGRSYCRNCEGEQSCVDGCALRVQSCLDSCTPQVGPTCRRDCQRQNARCLAACRHGDCP